MPSGCRHHEKIIQDENACHCRRGKTRIQLNESDRRAFLKRYEENGLIVFEAREQKPSAAIQIARLAVELAVSIEQRNEQI